MANGQAQTNGAAKTRDPEFYAGFSRFEIECEFVQSLSNPLYIQHLAINKYFDDPAFVAYLDYLNYFRQPEYLKFLLYPGPTLRALELLQQEQFRKDAINPGLIEAMAREGFEAATAGL
ncbi:Mediator of RNA polymerase II transcription subunit 31 [Elasticomyces elasticus]|nr:Mediator of RNA polymerase II transcription subunit 31 [Elasticomyces elasticus]KAK5726989.1 Mediator of RNA polymerase II transcription subunit 31 [Elasticomyces elasticus]